MENNSPVVYCGGCCLFLLVIILAFSWGTVEPNEWGLKYNSIGKSIDKSTVYDGGRYFVFLFNSFVTFPRTIQMIEFSTRVGANSQPLRTRTAEGLALGLSIAFEYQLIPGKLPDLYTLTNVNYEQTFVRIARDTILQEAGKYEAPQYWQERTKIGDAMRQRLDDELSKAYTRCVYLQILEVELPESYEDSIVQTQVEVQNSKMKKFEQEAAIIRKQIDIMRSENEQAIKLINATGAAESYRLMQSAKATATQNIIQAETSQYQAIIDNLGLNQEQLNQYIFYNGMVGKNTNMFVGFTNNMFVNQNTNTN